MKNIFTKEKLKLVMRHTACYWGSAILFFAIILGATHAMMLPKNNALNQMKIIAQNPVPYEPQETFLLNQILQSPKMSMGTCAYCFNGIVFFFFLLLFGFLIRKHVSTKYKKLFLCIVGISCAVLFGTVVFYMPFMIINPGNQKLLIHWRNELQFFQQATTREELNLGWVERIKITAKSNHELDEMQQRWEIMQENEEQRNEALSFFDAMTSRVHQNFISRIETMKIRDRGMFIIQWEEFWEIGLIFFLWTGIMIFRAAGAHPKNDGKLENCIEKKA